MYGQRESEELYSIPYEHHGYVKWQPFYTTGCKPHSNPRHLKAFFIPLKVSCRLRLSRLERTRMMRLVAPRPSGFVVSAILNSVFFSHARLIAAEKTKPSSWALSGWSGRTCWQS